MSLICILNEDEICRVRRAVAEKTNIKRIITNCSKYVHATREMAVHLTRQTSSALPMFTINTVYTEIIENETIKCIEKLTFIIKINIKIL